jgi:hypothetical protein
MARIILDSEKARQGHTGDGLRHVLAISLSLALVGLIVVALLLSANEGSLANMG